MATKKTTKNTKKRGRPASKSNTKRTASSRKNTSKKTKQASPLAREIVFLALFVFAILSLLSLFQMCGVFGKGLSALLWTAGSTGVCFSGLFGCDCRFVSGKCEKSETAPQGLV